MFLDYLAKLLPKEQDRLKLLSYMQSIIKKPDYKFTWWPLLQGVEGNGKSTIGKILERIIGQNVVHQLTSDMIKGHNTSWKENCRLVVINEIKPFIDAELLSELTKCIYEKNQIINKLYAPQTQLNVHYNGIIYTNYELDLVESDSIVSMKTAKIDTEYFKKYYEWLENGGYKSIEEMFK